MNITSLKALCKRGKIATRKWWLKLATALQTADNTPRMPYTPCNQSQTCMYLYQHPSGLQLVTKTKATSNALDPAAKTAVVDFCTGDSMSQMMPGKADVVTLCKEDGTKEKRQKRHLIMTVSESYKEFKSENPICQIGKSTFASLRPKHVLLNSKMLHSLCIGHV